jgi:hypothetical protein
LAQHLAHSSRLEIRWVRPGGIIGF